MTAPTTPPATPLARTTGEDGRPRLVEPELTRVDGAVREVAVLAFAPAPAAARWPTSPSTTRARRPARRSSPARTRRGGGGT
ncbi:hypothetical protein ACFQVA_16270 [Actinomadura keratinilytica]